MYVSNCKNGLNSVLPSVFAFEVETSLRKLFEEVLDPILITNVENNKRISHLEELTKTLDSQN